MSARSAGSADLIAAVGRLWPDGEVDLVRGRHRGRSGRRSLLVVPSAAAPRLLVPDHRRSAAAALQRHSAALSWAESFGRVGVGGALAVGATGLLADRVEVDADGDDIEAHLSGVLGGPVRVAIGIGPARANRKPVLAVADTAGRTVAFAKVGDTATAAAHVRGEAAALAQVGAHRWRHWRVPELLDDGEWRGMPVLVTSALRTGPWSLLARRPPAAALAELADVFDEGRSPLAVTPWWRRGRATAAALGDATRRERLGAALDRVEQRHGDRLLRVSAWHGDLTPWNVGWGGHRVQVWDWERFERGVPTGLDAVHFAAAHATRRHGFEVAVLAGAVSGATDPSTAATYLAALAWRYLAAAEAPGGDAIRARADVALAALEGASGR